MTVLPDEIEQVIIDIDLEKKIPCESKAWGDCDRPAEWIMVMPCCRTKILMCSFHKEWNQINSRQRLETWGLHGICYTCHSEVTRTPDWVKL